MNKLTETKGILTFVLPFSFGLLLLVLLQTQVLHKMLGLQLLQLPLPSQIGMELMANRWEILSNAKVTLLPVLLGMVAGGLIGYGIAILATFFPKGAHGSLILMTAINSVPIIALATVMNRWFDHTFAAKTAVIILLTMGIMSANAFRGLNDPKPYAIDLMRSYGASKLKILRKLQYPQSLPDVITAFKINISVAMTGVIISEFFSSDTAGLGFMIKYCLKVGNQKAQGWAYIAAAAAVSLILYGSICLIEKQVLSWHISTE